MFRSTQIPLLAVFCVSIYFLMFETSRPAITVNVQSDPTIDEMSKIIQKQRERIEYLSSHPKVVLRCPDDESQIKYPRKASDDLTEIIINTNDECGNSSILDAIIMVHTAANHFHRRERFRQTYANYSNTKPFRLKVVFLIGSVVEASMKIQLEMENREYGDTVLGAFLDTYQNLTLKAVMGFRWLANTCPDAKLLIKMDDDVFFNVRKFFTEYWQQIGNNRKTKSIHCLVWHNAHVGRAGKWKVEKNLFADASYPFPYCAGFFAIVTADLIKPMYVNGKNVDFFWIDDVFLYGMVPAVIKGVNFVQLGGGRKALTQSYSEYKKCREIKGTAKCPIWGALTNGENEFDIEYTALFNPPTVLNQTLSNKTQVIDSNQTNHGPPNTGKHIHNEESDKQKRLADIIVGNKTN